MKDHISITRLTDEEKNKPHSFQRRFLPSISSHSHKSAEVNEQKESSLHIPEWQFMDYPPVEPKKKEEIDLYVADWQMNS